MDIDVGTSFLDLVDLPPTKEATSSCQVDTLTPPDRSVDVIEDGYPREEALERQETGMTPYNPFSGDIEEEMTGAEDVTRPTMQLVPETDERPKIHLTLPNPPTPEWYPMQLPLQYPNWIDNRASDRLGDPNESRVWRQRRASWAQRDDAAVRGILPSPDFEAGDTRYAQSLSLPSIPENRVQKKDRDGAIRADWWSRISHMLDHTSSSKHRPAAISMGE